MEAPALSSAFTGTSLATRGTSDLFLLSGGFNGHDKGRGLVSLLWGIGESSNSPLDLLWHLPRWEGKAASLVLSEATCHNSQSGLYRHWGGRPSPSWQEGRSRLPTWRLRHHSLARRKVLAPRCLLVWLESEVTLFFLRCSLKKSCYCPKCFFVSLGYPFPGSVAGERRQFLSGSIGISGLWASLLQAWYIQDKRKILSTHSHVLPRIPKIPSHPTFFLPLRFILCLFHIQCPEVLVVCSRVVTEKYIYSNFLETEVQMIVF